MSHLTASLRRIVFAVTGLLLALTGVLSAAGSASAYQQTNATYGSGNVTPYRVDGKIGNSCYPVGNCPVRQVYVPAPTVNRSPSSSGWQKLAVTTRVHHWTGRGWVVEKAHSQAYWIRPGQGAIRPYNLTFRTAVGIKRVTFALTWYLSDTGTRLGSRTVLMNGHDYGCPTGGCTTHNGYLRFG